MNNKGFTLVELLAVIVLLSIIAGIVITSNNVNLDKTKKNSEEIFVKTIKDSISVYLANEPEELKFSIECDNILEKKHGDIKVYKATYYKSGISRDYLNFDDIINSIYHPIDEDDFINPANEDVSCNRDVIIDVYRDEDYIYYYSVDKNSMNCLKNIDGDYSNTINNLPKGYSCR